MENKPWFYSKGQDVGGPVALSDLERLADSGELSARDLVWQEGMENSLAAKDVVASLSGISPPKPPNKLDGAAISKHAKDASEDAWIALRMLALNPVGGLAVAFSRLGEERAWKVGIVFGLVFDVCILIGVTFLLSNIVPGASGLGTLIKTAFLGLVPFGGIIAGSAIIRKLFRAKGTLASDVFLSGAWCRSGPLPPGWDAAGPDAGMNGTLLMPDDGRIYRQWILLRLLAGRRFGATLREISEELEVLSRTLQRDLKVLRTVFPLDQVPGPRGLKTWKLRSSNGAPDLAFALDEALALYLGRRFLQPLAGTLIWEAAQSAFKKIRTALGKPALDYLDKMAARLHPTAFGMADYSRKSELIDRLLISIEDATGGHTAFPNK